MKVFLLIALTLISLSVLASNDNSQCEVSVNAGYVESKEELEAGLSKDFIVTTDNTSADLTVVIRHQEDGRESLWAGIMGEPEVLSHNKRINYKVQKNDGVTVLTGTSKSHSISKLAKRLKQEMGKLNLNCSR